MPQDPRTTLRRRSNRASTVAMALMFTIGLAGCGSSDNDAATTTQVGELEADAQVVEELDSLYAASQDEGQTEVTVYLGGAPLDDVWETFSARYPEITVQPASVYGAEYISKIEQEQSSGQVIADLVLQGPSSVYQHALDGYFAEFDAASTDEVHEVARDEDLVQWCVAPYGEAAAITYNTNEVSAEEAPSTWADLTDPKWNDRLVLPQLDKPGTTSRTFGVLAENGVINDAWLDGLAANEPVGVAESTMTGAALVSGKGDVGLGRQATLVREIQKGAPLDVVYPMDDATVISTYLGCVMDKAPNKEAAQLLLTWLFTQEAQESLAEAAYFPLVEGVEPLPPFPPIEEVDNFSTVPGKEEPRLITTMTEKMKKRFG